MPVIFAIDIIIKLVVMAINLLLILIFFIIYVYVRLQIYFEDKEEKKGNIIRKNMLATKNNIMEGV